MADCLSVDAGRATTAPGCRTRVEIERGKDLSGALALMIALVGIYLNKVEEAGQRRVERHVGLISPPSAGRRRSCEERGADV
jgi:hypothetical protein